MGRATYLFNATIAGIERADALLIVGSNPRREAAVLNARIRKRWRAGKFPIALIGEKVDLTYPYDYLGAGPDTLAELVAGKHSFSQVLKGAERPLIVVGAGALARADGAAVAALAARAAIELGASKKAGTASAFCTRRPRASARWKSASCPAMAGSTPPRWRKRARSTLSSCWVRTRWTCRPARSSLTSTPTATTVICPLRRHLRGVAYPEKKETSTPKAGAGVSTSFPPVMMLPPRRAHAAAACMSAADGRPSRWRPSADRGQRAASGCAVVGRPTAAEAAGTAVGSRSRRRPEAAERLPGPGLLTGLLLDSSR